MRPKPVHSSSSGVQNSMGNYKFRLSDMISGSWLRKFKHSNTTSSTQKSLLPSDDNKDSWFLREVLAPTPHRTPSPLDHAHRRKSYHFQRKFQVVQPIRPLTPPRGSVSKPRRSASLKRPTRCSSPRLVKTSVSACCSCRAFASFDLMQAKPGCPVQASPPDSPFLTTAICLQSPPLRSVLSSELIDQLVSCKATTCICRCRGNFDHSTTVARGLDRDPLSELELPPVIKKSREFNKMVTSSRKGGENKKPVATDNSRNSGSRPRSSSSILVKTVKGETCSWMVWANNKKQKPRPIVNLATSPVGGMSLRVNSPNVGSRKQSQAHHPGRKSGKVSLSPRPVTSLGPRTRRSGGASDGFAVVKTSANPWKDFRESMVEMIVENDIRALKDLEDLLACYLKLNSDEYHDVIIGVFKEIWFDFSHVQSE